MSDSNGYIVDENGIDLDAVKQIKEVRRGRIKEYVADHPTATYHEGSKGIWTVKCDIALPCATQNELDLDGAKALVANGVFAVAEGANMPSTLEATEYFQEHGVLFGAGEGGQRGRRCHQRAGNEPEQHASELDFRGSGRKAQRHHGRHLQQRQQGRRGVRYAGQSGCGR